MLKKLINIPWLSKIDLGFWRLENTDESWLVVIYNDDESLDFGLLLTSLLGQLQRVGQVYNLSVVHGHFDLIPHAVRN